MNEQAVLEYLETTFDGIDIVRASGNYFIFYNPAGESPDHRMAFATLVTNDEYDRASDLNRPSVFRLNIGLSSDTYRTLFGPQPRPCAANGVVDTGHDFTALDQVMPHPIYAPMSWVCVLSPSDATFQSVQPLLTEAYDRAVKRRRKPTTTE